MSDADEILLPLARHRCATTQEETEPACSPTAYVSNEEAAIAKALLELRERAHAVKSQLAAAESVEARKALDAQLAELRAERAQLSRRREEAFRRKMIMLGHLPPDDSF